MVVLNLFASSVKKNLNIYEGTQPKYIYKHKLCRYLCSSLVIVTHVIHEHTLYSQNNFTFTIYALHNCEHAQMQAETKMTCNYIVRENKH